MEQTLVEQILSHLSVSFSRSGGAGGQNVNKVNTRATVRIPLAALTVLSDEERELIRSRLGDRVTGDGDVVVSAEEERSQLRNRRIAEDRLIALIQRALTRRRPRKQTKPPAAANRERLRQKRIRSERKSSRGRIDRE